MMMLTRDSESEEKDGVKEESGDGLSKRLKMMG